MDTCYFIEFSPTVFLAREAILPILTSHSANIGAWAKVVMAASEASTIVRSRTILPNSLIVDVDYFSDDEQEALYRLSGYGAIKIRKVSPPARPKVKYIASGDSEVAAPKLRQPMDFDAPSWFEQFWLQYPARNGQKLRKSDAKNWFLGNILTIEQVKKLEVAVENYKQSSAVINGFTKDAINFLPDWESWVVVGQETSSGYGNRSRPTQAQINRASEDKLIL